VRAEVQSKAPSKLSRRAWMKQRGRAMGKESEASVKPQSYCTTRNPRFRVAQGFWLLVSGFRDERGTNRNQEPGTSN